MPNEKFREVDDLISINIQISQLMGNDIMFRYCERSFDDRGNSCWTEEQSDIEKHYLLTHQKKIFKYIEQDYGQMYPCVKNGLGWNPVPEYSTNRSYIPYLLEKIEGQGIKNQYLQELMDIVADAYNKVEYAVDDLWYITPDALWSAIDATPIQHCCAFIQTMTEYGTVKNEY